MVDQAGSGGLGLWAKTLTISGRITLSPAWKPLAESGGDLLVFRAGSSVGTVARALWRRGSKASVDSSWKGSTPWR